MSSGRAANIGVSIEEVRSWLRHLDLDRFIYLLIDNGYDDLEALSHATPAEIDELVALFTQEESKESISFLCSKLREIGIAAYRKSGLPPPPADLHKPPVSRPKPPPPKVPPPPRPGQVATSSSAAPPASAPTAPRPVSPGPHAGFLSVLAGDWTDKHCVFKDGSFSWFKSRRDASPEGVANASNITAVTFKGDSEIELIVDNTAYCFNFEGADREVWSKIFHFFANILAYDATVAASSPTSSSASPTAAAPAASTWPVTSDSFELNGATPPGSERSSMTPPPPRDESVSIAPPPPPTSSGPALPTSPRKPIQASALRTPSSHSLSDPKRAEAPRESLEERKDKRFQTLLREGALFKKFQHNMGQKRMIWATETLDKLLWGDEQKKEIKGFLKSAAIIEVNRGHDKTKLRIYLVSINRTLELEARDPAMHNEWMSAFKYLTQAAQKAEERLNELRESEEFVRGIQAKAKKYADFLRAGAVFRKFKRGTSETTRHIWFSANMDRVMWGDVGTHKPKGDILVEDMVSVKDVGAVRLSIFAIDRELELEAKDEAMKLQWLDALGFWITYWDKLSSFNASF